MNIDVTHNKYMLLKDEESIHLASDPSTGEVDFIECDSPVELIQAILSRKEDKTLSIDKLGAVSLSLVDPGWGGGCVIYFFFFFFLLKCRTPEGV